MLFTVDCCTTVSCHFSDSLYHCVSHSILYGDSSGLWTCIPNLGWLVEWGFYALSASKAIFRARTYNCNLFSPVMMIT